MRHQQFYRVMGILKGLSRYSECERSVQKNLPHTRNGLSIPLSLNMAVKNLAFLHRIPDVPCSTVGPKAGYSDMIFCGLPQSIHANSEMVHEKKLHIRSASFRCTSSHSEGLLRSISPYP